MEVGDVQADEPVVFTRGLEMFVNRRHLDPAARPDAMGLLCFYRIVPSVTRGKPAKSERNPS